MLDHRDALADTRGRSTSFVSEVDLRAERGRSFGQTSSWGTWAASPLASGGSARSSVSKE